MELIITTEMTNNAWNIHFWQRSSSLRHLFLEKQGIIYVMISQI